MGRRPMAIASELRVVHFAEDRFLEGANPRLAAAGVTILPVWSSTALAWDAHIDAGDCTHYCQPGIPGIWAGLLIQAVARQSRPLS